MHTQTQTDRGRLEAQEILIKSLEAQISALKSVDIEPVRDPEAVEALIKAVGYGLVHGFTASRWIAVNAAYSQLEGIDE